MRPIILPLALVLMAQPAVASMPQPPCVAERNWVAAEETTPGVLLRLAREALADCLARQHAAVQGSPGG